MFWNKKSKEDTTAVEEYARDELKEYVSVDSLKGHLVDMLEENRQLKQQLESMEEKSRKDLKAAQTQKELSLVTADEYKKREREAKQEAQELKRRLDFAEKERDEYKRRFNDSVSSAEIAKADLQREKANMSLDAAVGKTIREYTEENPDWEKKTKTVLVEVIKNALDAGV